MPRKASITKLMRAILDRERRELNDFFIFPTWFPKYLESAYRRFLQWILTDVRIELRERGSNEAPSAVLRSWIEALKSDDNAPTPGVFARHHRPLVHELVVLEEAARMRRMEAFKHLAAPDDFHAYQASKQGQLRGKRSGEARKGKSEAHLLTINCEVQKLRADRTRVRTQWYTLRFDNDQSSAHALKSIAEKWGVTSEAARKFFLEEDKKWFQRN